METERRAALCEIRVEGRKLAGTVMKFGEVSPYHRERFEPGAFRMAESVVLDLSHDRNKAVAWMPDGGLELRDNGDALEMTATLPAIPAADYALAEIRAGRMNGLSVHFVPLKERREAGIRVIEEALLRGVAILSRPSYEGSRVESRARRRRIWL